MGWTNHFFFLPDVINRKHDSEMQLGPGGSYHIQLRTIKWFDKWTCLATTISLCTKMQWYTKRKVPGMCVCSLMFHTEYNGVCYIKKRYLQKLSFLFPCSPCSHLGPLFYSQPTVCVGKVVYLCIAPWCLLLPWSNRLKPGGIVLILLLIYYQGTQSYQIAG